MDSQSPERSRWSPWRLLLPALAVGIATGPAPAWAQAEKKADASSIFDDEKDEAKKDDAKTDPAKKAEAAAKKSATSERAVIGFTQQNAAAQMTELEERMFRLAEALRGLEPENASRLSLALRFSREELILEQMRETYKLLNDEQLNRAETESKELIAKLEHLRNLLLAEDLDFQLKLARLRQMRETLGQLDRIVKEQRRELGWSRFALEQRKRLDRMSTRRPDLEALARDQKALIAEIKKLKKDKSARSSARERASKLRGAVAAMAGDPLFADLQPPHLRRADADLADVLAALSKSEGDLEAQNHKAAEAGSKALEWIEKERTRFDEQAKQAQETIAESAFRRRVQDQAKNRETAEKLGVTSARLGDAGVALRKDLIRASAVMETAAGKLGKVAPGPAAEDQSTALESLSRSRDDLAQAVERLLEELRGELRTRLIGDLVEMHEEAKYLRETTQAQAPRVAKKSRTALLAVAGLSKKLVQTAEKTEHLLALVEEVEYGIALPTTLRILGREMRSIGVRLEAGDVSARSIAMETRIEQDLAGIAGAVRRLPSETPPPPGTPLSTNPRERERELNRMIAELTMVRMLQARLNDDTVGVDKDRPAATNLPPAVRREIEGLEATQDEVRDALARIADRLSIPSDDEP